MSRPKPRTPDIVVNRESSNIGLLYTIFPDFSPCVAILEGVA